MNRLLTNNFRLLLDWFWYVLTAKYRKGHGVHSPIVYELVEKVIYDKKHFSDYKTIENLVHKLKSDSSEIDFIELGGGSQIFHETKRSIKKITLNSSVHKKYGRLLYRMVNYYKPDLVLELGTSIGISTLYMAMGDEGVQVHTLEGNSSVIEKAIENAQSLGVSNINFHCVNFNEALPDLLNSIEAPWLVYIDGNHTYEATLNYYRQISKTMKKGIIVFDDIYWSQGMKNAWREIQSLENVTIDIFQFGIVMLGDMLTPGKYRIRF